LNGFELHDQDVKSIQSPSPSSDRENIAPGGTTKSKNSMNDSKILTNPGSSSNHVNVIPSPIPKIQNQVHGGSYMVKTAKRIANSKNDNHINNTSEQYVSNKSRRDVITADSVVQALHPAIRKFSRASHSSSSLSTQFQHSIPSANIVASSSSSKSQPLNKKSPEWIEDINNPAHTQCLTQTWSSTLNTKSTAQLSDHDPDRIQSKVDALKRKLDR
jgi:hypothetical protein